MYILMLLKQRPIEPVALGVLAVSIVVAMLRSPDFIAHHKHRNPERKQRHGHEILHLTVSDTLDRGIVCWTLNSVVPAPIIVSTVSVVLAVCLVVLLIVGNHIIER